MKDKLNGMAVLFSVAVLLAGGTAGVHGQSALDGFNPNVNGTVHVVVTQPDGKILIGGAFTSVLGVTRNNIARLNPDGTLDTAFDPNANSAVHSIAVTPGGTIFMGGDFTAVAPNGGAAETRNHIARLWPDGTLTRLLLEPVFDPNANDTVRSIVVLPDLSIVVGGDFDTIGGQARNHIARLSFDGVLDTAFDPNANFAVASLAVQPDGKILAGGIFSNIGGQTRSGIARLDGETGTVDSFDPHASGLVLITSVAVQSDGKILVGGFFDGIAGQARTNVARLNPDGTFDTAFNPNANAGVYAIAVQTDGKILVGGNFSNIGGQARSRIARLEAVTGLADSFNPNANGDVNSIAVQADGKILAGGDFNGASSISGQTRNRIARLETDGRLDQTLDLSTVGSHVVATAVQPDGKILIGGSFTTVLGVARTNMARLNTDGTLDAAFNPSANESVLSIVVGADGRILAGGAFTSIGGQARNRIARLNGMTGAADSFDPNANGVVYTVMMQPDGKILAGGEFTAFAPNGGATVTRRRIVRLDPTTGSPDSFNPDSNGDVYSIAMQPDGKVLAGGAFGIIGGQTRLFIARLEATNGLADLTFAPNADQWVRSIVVQADGKILAGGQFTSIGGQARFYIARLDATNGTVDPFNPGANGFVYTLAVQADGKILAGGQFSSIGGSNRVGIARLDATNGVADAFNPNANYIVYSVAVQADGKVLAGGAFTTIGGAARNLFARLGNDTAALQNLSVTKVGIITHGTILWTRSGGGPQFTRVTFEYSTDNVNYAFLGDGTLNSSNWTLTGLSLPAEQYFYIRARGYHSGGFHSGSESVTELVRQGGVTQLAGPEPRLNIQRNSNTEVVLSWPASFLGFTLEASTNLNLNVWSVVSPAPVISGANIVVTNAATSPACFYRLHK